jgi:plasmid stabilization system protein ParE
VARIEIAPRADADLRALIESHRLPRDTKRRVVRAIRPLRRFPRIGRELSGRWRRYRWLRGPWRWMLIVYTYDQEQDLVAIATIQDPRSSTAATSSR